jgi:hypothetical protein
MLYLIAPTGRPQPTFTALLTKADLNDPDMESNTILDNMGVCGRPGQAAMVTATAMATVTVTAAAAMDIAGLVGLPDLVNWYVHCLLLFSAGQHPCLTLLYHTDHQAREKEGVREKEGKGWIIFILIKIKFFKFCSNSDLQAVRSGTGRVGQYKIVMPFSKKISPGPRDTGPLNLDFKVTEINS